MTVVVVLSCGGGSSSDALNMCGVADVLNTHADVLITCADVLNTCDLHSKGFGTVKNKETPHAASVAAVEKWMLFSAALSGDV